MASFPAGEDTARSDCDSCTGDPETTEDHDWVATARRISTAIAPFLDILSVLVQGLTAYTLLREVA